MTTFDEFCLHYGLDADDPDAQEQYRQYREAGDLMRCIVGGGEKQEHQQEDSKLRAESNR